MTIGQTVTITVKVTDAMQAGLEGVIIHGALYGTAAMVTHFEWAARQHILACLEPGEEGVGYHVSLDHCVPVALGSIVNITAALTGIEVKAGGQTTLVTCDCLAHCQGRLIGRGQVIQALLPLSQLEQRTLLPMDS